MFPTAVWELQQAELVPRARPALPRLQQLESALRRRERTALRARPALREAEQISSPISVLRQPPGDAAS